MSGKITVTIPVDPNLYEQCSLFFSECGLSFDEGLSLFLRRITERKEELLSRHAAGESGESLIDEVAVEVIRMLRKR